MTDAPSSPESLAEQIQAALPPVGLPPLAPDIALRLGRYVALFVRWNGRTNLSAIRDETGIIKRHIIESIALASRMPDSVVSVLDYGSGGGLPGIPLAICRPTLQVTLAESQNKKAAFLREAVRFLALSATVHAARAEQLTTLYDCVTLRAVDRMEQAIASASLLVRPGGYLALMTSAAQLPSQQAASGQSFVWQPPIPLPGSEQSLLALARKL